MTATDVETVAWDLEPLLAGRTPDDLLAEAGQRADAMAGAKGTVAVMDAKTLGALLAEMAEISELIGRATDYASLRFAVDTADPKVGARLQKTSEQAASIRTRMVWFDVEWAALDDAKAEALLAAEGLDHCRHHLRKARDRKQYVLSEPEERILTEKGVTGRSAWARLFGELTSAIRVDIKGEDLSMEQALSRLADADRHVRREAAESVTAALQPGLRTRAYIFNTLMQDKAIDDRLRGFDHWLAARNVANEASDESVQALVDAVQKRYDIPQRWYRLKAKLLGLDRLADYDRVATLEAEETEFPWDDARELVLDSYRSFSPDLGALAQRFFDERWIDAPVRPAKRGGAFCAYTVPSHHPYVFLNWTFRRRDVLTLAHELGHGVHGALAQQNGQSIFHQMTPLTLAETASVFGETVVFGRLIEQTDDPNARLALLAANIEDGIATVYRQTAMNRFEHAVHTARRDEGELSMDRFGQLWTETQGELFGDSVEMTDGFRSWWSYIPHFIGTPGYVYAYSYGQLLALSVYKQYEEQGSDFVPRYLHLLGSGGSDTPENLGRIVGCDLADPGFWDGGIAIIEKQLEAAETAAFEAGRLQL